MAVLAGAAGIAPEPAPDTPPPSTIVRFSITVQGYGQVYVSPPGGACLPGQTCTVEYQWGDRIRLEAVAKANSSFKGWDGDCARYGRDPAPVLVMEGSKECVAQFVAR